MSLPLKFLLLLLLVIAPISVVVAAFNYITAGNLLKQQAQQQQRVWAAAKRDVLATALIQEGDRLRDLSDSDLVQVALKSTTPLSEADLQARADAWAKASPSQDPRSTLDASPFSRGLDAYRSRFRNRLFALIARPNGELVGVSTPFWPQFDQKRFAWWPQANAIPALSYTGTLSIQDIDSDAILISVVVSDRLQQGKIIGVLVLGVSVEEIIEPNIRDLPVGESAWLVDSAGNALERYDITAKMAGAAPQITTYSTKQSLPSAWLPILTAPASAEGDSAELPASAGFPDTVLAYAPVSASVSSYTQNDPQTLGAVNALGWRIVRTAPRALAYAQLNVSLIALVGGTVLTFVGIVVAVLFTVGLLLLRPIRRMDRAMSNVAQGDFSTRVGGNSNDELGRLGQSFNQMVGDLDTLLQERERQQQAQREVSHRLQGSASELQSSVAQQNQFALQQATALAEISATFGQLSRSANRIAQYSQQVAEAADVLQDEQQEGNTALRQTRTILGELRHDSESLSSIAANLDRSSTAISDVISELNNLADETKLLALNASIEASSAGVAGHRFAVIATEVQSLADQSATAAEAAQQSLTEVQENIARAVASIQRELSAISAGVQQSDRLESLMKIISDTITKLNQSAGVIQQDTKQQREGSAVAAHTIDSLATASQQLAQRSAVITNEAEQLTSLARRLNTAASENGASADSPRPQAARPGEGE